MDLFSWVRRSRATRTAPPRGSGADGVDLPPARVPAGPSAPADVPTPVTRERLLRWFERQGFGWFVDNEGDVGGLWKGRVFYFFLFGAHRELLQVRGHWQREFALERLPEVLEICNEWNTERIWPKCYARVRDDGMVNVSSEVVADLELGVTDGQLDMVLQGGIASATAFFDTLDRLYPDPAAVAP